MSSFNVLIMLLLAGLNEAVIDGIKILGVDYR